MNPIQRWQQWRGARRAERRLFRGTDEEFRARTERYADRIPQITRTLKKGGDAQ